jgi:hypothetical protein
MMLGGPLDPAECVIRAGQYGYALVDADEYDRIRQHVWRAAGGYMKAEIDGVWVLMHHFVLPPPPGFVVDHINHVKLDNRKCNLRVCTPTQNLFNRLPVGRTSQFRGVSLDKKTGKWKAGISRNSKWKHLGYYSTETEAAQAYNEVAIEYHGEFATLNDVETGTIATRRLSLHQRIGNSKQS